MSQSVIIAVFSFLILIVLGALFLYLSFKGAKDDAFFYWRQILEKLRLRDDMIPNLLETIRLYCKNEENLMAEMISLRVKSWPVAEPNAIKVHAELNLSSNLHSIWELSKKYPGLNVDTNFLSLKKDFTDLGKEIDEMGEVYNAKIRSFNRHIGFILWQPFSRLFGLKKLPVFEFEP
jgi:LemA protein